MIALVEQGALLGSRELDMGISLTVRRSGLSLVLVALVAVLLAACDDTPQMGMRVEGDPIAGSEISVFLTGPGGNPATQALVTVNGEVVPPDNQGRVVISVPVDAKELVIEAAQGQAEGKLKIAILPAPR